jgi:uncharacterized repeat protein (TIGR03803 family)
MRTLAILIVAYSAFVVRASDTILHTFAGEPTDGRNPGGGMTLSGGLFYGTTRYGGAHSKGVIFRMNPDGSGYAILHHFAGGSGDGEGPIGRPASDGSALYGTTFNGGLNNSGTVYSIDTSGIVKLLHTFPTGANDGAIPSGSLIIIGSSLFGMTEEGGPDNLGTVFRINTDGTGYTVLHNFANSTDDGHLPFGALTALGSTLFGTTSQGGHNSNGGTVFKIDIGGSNYSLLHEFGVHGDGYNPEKTLTPVGSTLYGVTNQGGTAGTGTVFKINTDGTGYAVLYSFEGRNGNDGQPSSALTLVGNHFIASTDPIDNTIPGLLYSIKANGSAFGVLYEFNGSTTEGREPGGDLVTIGSTMFGVTSQGGSGNGVIYALQLPTLGITIVSYSNDGHVNLSGQDFPNTTISIDTTPDLTTSFNPLGTTTSDANGTFVYDDNLGMASPSLRFYRVVDE